MAKRVEEPSSSIVVLLTCSAREEKPFELLPRIPTAAEAHQEFGKGVSFVTSSSLFKDIEKRDAATAIASLKKLQNRGSKDEGASVYILTDYPATRKELADFVNLSGGVSTLDGIVKLVNRGASGKLQRYVSC
jgi:hypothetical protein